MKLFQNKILNSIKQDESIVATRWAEYQKYLAKEIYKMVYGLSEGRKKINFKESIKWRRKRQHI